MDYWVSSENVESGPYAGGPDLTYTGFTDLHAAIQRARTLANVFGEPFFVGNEETDEIMVEPDFGHWLNTGQ